MQEQNSHRTTVLRDFLRSKGNGCPVPFEGGTKARRGHSGLAVSTPLIVRDAGVSPPHNRCVQFLQSDDSRIVGLGVDLVAVSRVERLTRRDEDIFRLRILGEHERAEIPFDAETRSRNCHYAASIAGKEALLKALGSGLSQGDRWCDIEVVGQRTGMPRLAVSGAPLERMTALHADGIQFSMSIQGGHALACVLLTSAEGPASRSQSVKEQKPPGDIPGWPSLPDRSSGSQECPLPRPVVREFLPSGKTNESGAQ